MPLEERSRAKKSICFIVPAPVGISPGQRFRFEHYLPVLKENDVRFNVRSFYTMDDWNILYAKGKLIRKAWVVVKGMMKRWVDIFRLIPYDFVYIYREAAPIGPPIFEWIIAKVFRKKIIYDFDDAIWIPITAKENRIAAGIKFFSKIGTICKWSYKVSVGNDFLKSFVQQHNKNVIVIPTVVDTESQHSGIRNQREGDLTVGWTGTFSTLKYLDMVLPALQELQETHNFTFLVIADKDPLLPLKNYRFVKWNKQTEVSDLMQMHVGLMPLWDDEMSKGKCGFKAIQYMSLGVPAVVSPVGVNSVIVNDGVNGFVTDSNDEWISKLAILLQSAETREKFGKAAQQKIEDEYSVTATKQIFLQLFR